MARIVLTPEQVRILSTATEPVELRDEEGNLLAVVDPVEARAIQEAKRRSRSKRPRIPSALVSVHLDLLEQHLAQGGTLDSARALLVRLQADSQR